MAIALDAVSSGTGTGASATLSHTCSGSQRILVVGVSVNGSGSGITGVTYNGVALTLGRADGPAHNARVALYYLINPPTGAHNIVASFSGGSFPFDVAGVSYTGAAQSGQPDANSGAVSGSNGTSASTTLTTIADNCWHIGITQNEGGLPSAGSGTTNRASNSGYAIADTNGAITPAGSNTLSWTWSGTAPWVVSGISIAPFVSSPPTLDTVAATDITDVSATLNGEITDVGSGDADLRGFVYGTTSESDPGNTAPGSSAYDANTSESGTFGAASFDAAVAGLTLSTTYYARAWAHNGDGYAYGNEISFDTSATPPFRFENIAGVVYDPDDHQTIFAERLNDMLDRLDALDGG